MEEKYGIKTKTAMQKELSKKFDERGNFIITNYKNLSSQQIEKLRREFVKSASEYFVVKNSIMKRVLDGRDLDELKPYVTGEVGIGFMGEVIPATKTLVDFAKQNPSFKLNCAVVDGKILAQDRIKHMASLPSKEVLIAMILSSMKSPITGFVGVLSSLLRNLVYAINEIKKKKEGGKENGYK